MKMRKRTRNIIIILLVVKLVTTGILLAYFFWWRNTTDYRIRSLARNDLAAHSVRDYGSSILRLHPSNVFELEIIFIEERLFTAIGTFTRTRDSITFYFIDAWMLRPDGQITQDLAYPHGTHIGRRKEYRIERGQIRFTDHNDNIFWFSR